jgi:hypothetical protein
MHRSKWLGQGRVFPLPHTIPAATPDGDYLLRVEHIALHMAMQANIAQFYLSCTQVKITGGGSGQPGPLAALPGAYKGTDPGYFAGLGQVRVEPERLLASGSVTVDGLGGDPR